MKKVATVSVIGLGKLGSPMVAVFAEKGFGVIGVDKNPLYVAKVKMAEAPVAEPKLQEYFSRNANRIDATQNYHRAIMESQVSFIIVPTPSDENGKFSHAAVLDTCFEIGSALREKPEYHLVVLTSTVMPGSTGGEILAALEKFSGKKCGTDFGLCYSPEFIALGSVIHNLLYPDYTLIGESDPVAGAMLESFYASTVENHAPSRRMNFVNAELTKISVNTFVTAKMTFANMLARICEKLPDADSDVVSAALGADARIGSKYLKGAIGYGGPCFPRDNIAFGKLAAHLGVRSDLAEATDRLNEHQAEAVASEILNSLGSAKSISVLGLAYKPDTDFIEQSHGIKIVKLLAQAGLQITVHDPLALENARRELGSLVSYAESTVEALKASDFVFVATPSAEYRKIPSLLREIGSSRPRGVIDGWRLLESGAMPEGVSYSALGCHSGARRP